MSVQQPVDPEAVEQARQQIRGVVAEIAQLARTEVAPQQFFEGFLTRVVSALAASGGAVWTSEGDQRLGLCCQINLPQTRLTESSEDQMHHGRLVAQVFASGEGAIVAPQTKLAGDSDAGNPTPFLLVLGPLRTDGRTHGVVEIFQRPAVDLASQRGNLRFLLEMCQLAAGYLGSRERQRLGEREVLWGRLERFTHAVHQSLDLTETAYTLANEGCRLIECDRVSVAVRRGRRTSILAISGQDTVEKRANVVALLTRLAERVMATGEPLWYTGDNRNLPPQVEEALGAYVDESHTRTLGVLPLLRHAKPDPEQIAPPEAEILGALIVERIDQSGLTNAIRERSAIVCEHGTAALAHALQYDGIFLSPVWRTLTKSRWLVQARQLPKTIAVSAAVLVAAAILALWPVDFQINAPGTLQPANRRDVFVQEAGVVSEVFVKDGQHVAAGDKLLKLRSRDLEMAVADLNGKQASTFEQMGAAKRAQGESRLSYDERTRLDGQFQQYQKTYDSLTEQLKLLSAKESLLTVRSPVAGEVVAWDVEHRLQDRPVDKGQVLLSVADAKGKWELELLVPEDHVGHVVNAQAEQSKARAAEPLKVTYILATDPATSRQAKVVEIQTSAEVRGDQGNTVLVRAEIDDPKGLAPGDLRPGAAVTARIYCGRRSLGYVWFHDLVAFVRSKILFRI